MCMPSPLVTHVVIQYHHTGTWSSSETTSDQHFSCIDPWLRDEVASELACDQFQALRAPMHKLNGLLIS